MTFFPPHLYKKSGTRVPMGGNSRRIIQSENAQAVHIKINMVDI